MFCGPRMEEAHGTLFVSLPSLLDPTLAPPGRHIVHAFTPDYIDAWQVCEFVLFWCGGENEQNTKSELATG